MPSRLVSLCGVRRKSLAGVCTVFGGGSALDASQALLELVLGAMELSKRRRQVLELLVELLLDLSELLRLERVEVDCRRAGAVSRPSPSCEAKEYTHSFPAFRP